MLLSLFYIQKCDKMPFQISVIFAHYDSIHMRLFSFQAHSDADNVIIPRFFQDLRHLFHSSIFLTSIYLTHKNDILF